MKVIRVEIILSLCDADATARADSVVHAPESGPYRKIRRSRHNRPRLFLMIIYTVLTRRYVEMVGHARQAHGPEHSVTTRRSPGWRRVETVADRPLTSTPSMGKARFNGGPTAAPASGRMAVQS